MAKPPSRDDPSKPKQHGYEYKKQFYQSSEVAADYDEHRFRTPKRQRRNARKWAAIQKALALANGVKTIVDLPCGTGRFTGNLARAGYEVVGSDISAEMMGQAAKLPSVQHENIRGYVRADAEKLPFKSKSTDCLMSIRFLFHVDPETRRRMLREFGRVSRRWVIADYRHKYSFRYGVWRLTRAFGLTKRPFERVSVKSMTAEFEDAGLRVAKIIPVRRGLSDKWVVLAETGHVDPDSLKIKLQGSEYADLEIKDKLGEGKRSVVYRARWRGRDIGLKVYKPAAIARHSRKHKLPLAEFEHRRNRAFFDARGLSKYVAEPIGFVVEPGFQMSLQECLDGEVYYFAHRDHAAFISPKFMDDLAELVNLSHAAELYDIDLHAMNVMVDRHAGGPKLFDFNQIPFTERPQNPFVGLALKLGLLGRGSRDLRKLARFNNFDRVERKLLKFYEDGSSPA
ncbi:MAG: methyltransferase domain-containing protein [Steroidobacteraceae bacterium]|nr:methyltransferase domain-containing protein [Steroidobacteraceae bacterium]